MNSNALFLLSCRKQLNLQMAVNFIKSDRRIIMRYSVKDIAIMALTAAITVVIGYIFYGAGRLLPIPGNKFMVFAPLLSFMMFIPTCNIKKIGVITTISGILAFLMMPITVFMSIALIMSGITTDLFTLLLFQNYRSTWKIMASVGFYPVSCLLWAFIVSYYFTGNAIYNLTGGWLTIVILCVIIYILGVIGAYLSNKVIYTRIILHEK